MARESESSAYMHSIDSAVKKHGFENADEFYRLVLLVDLADPKNVAAFKAWKEGDGTKRGLLMLKPKEAA